MALPLARAAAVSTGLRVRQEVGEGGHADGADERLQREDRVPLAREKQLRHQHLRAEQCRAQHEPAHPRVEGEPPQPWAAVPAGAAAGGWLGLGLGEGLGFGFGENP